MEKEDLSAQIASFDGLWRNGYFEGDPLDPLAKSSFGSFGYTSILHSTYLRCIKPYVKKDTVALEIGPGRGAWTKTLLGAAEVWAMDALSAEYNGTFEYLNSPANLKYFQVTDFECRDLPELHFDYMFSFGCLCHVSYEGISEYAKNIFPKLRSGTNCFWHLADKGKYDAFLDAEEHYDIWRRLAPERKRTMPVKKVFEAVSAMRKPSFMTQSDFSGGQGTWHDAGISRTCEMLEGLGYKVLDEDVGTIPRDPIIHFIKP